jgi:carbon monoxide dehydrogenase subunit G|tara:strand:- start:8754 stop:9488 length:735 start_codon:yes stop_codon:yes gene_type:complete
MEIELSHVFSEPADALWAVLLDPEQVSKCVPGMQSVDVISDTEYHARIKVKIAFISANFTIRTLITEANRPHYLQAEASGQDKSVGSSVKAIVNMNLTDVGEGRTELRVKGSATVLGRLGTLGLNPMRTKAERMWEQFCGALEAHLSGDRADEANTVPDRPDARSPGSAADATRPLTPSAPSSAPRSARRAKGLFSWFGSRDKTEGLRIEVHRTDTRVVISCPASHADQCFAWLDRQLGPQEGK